MALFGARKQQAFGQQFDPLSNGPFGTPGYGDSMNERQMGAPVQGMGQLPDVANMPDMGGMQDQQPAKFKPNILGVIGDAMQVFGGGQATYMNGVREQQQRSELMRERAMQAQQERETGWQDYVRKATYDRENKAPGDDKLTRYMVNAGIDPASDKGKAIFAAAVTNEAYPERAVPYTDEQGNSGLRFIRSGMPPQQGAPVFGGWADEEEGGQTQPVSGNFPPKPPRRNNSGY